jgi:PAS domain S-box-containing protein/putative nucleotidyltransferase with HDIG domain
VLEKQKIYSEDFPCRRKDGKDILCRVSAAVIGKKLQHKEIVVMYEDITKTKHIEEALKDSEMKYFDLYENAPDGYYSLGPDGTILDVNTTWLKMLGYKRQEVIGKKKFLDLLSEGQKGFFRKNFRTLMENGSVQDIEYMLLKKDGSYLPIIVGATAIYDENGKFLRTRTIMRDISARTNYKKMLEQTVEEWRITFDSMPYGVLLLDMDFKIKRANKYFSLIYDIPFKEMRGQKCYKVIQSSELQKRFVEFSSARTINLNTFEYRDKKMKRTLMLYLTPIPDAQGLTSSLVLALIDITDIKNKEKKITDSRDAFFNMLKELDFSYKELKGLYEGLIHSFVNAIDAKSPWTKGHSERVTRYAISIAKKLKLDDEDIDNLRIASLLHDIGKIGTYDVILDNPHKLSAEEVRLINLHPVKGEKILKPIKQLQHLLPIIRHHHERIDGTGYPDKLKGDKIPFLSRILCIADSYDSMISDRPYRPAKTKQYAISELARCSNTQFDARAVTAFLSVLARK